MAFIHRRYVDVPILPAPVLPIDRVQFEYPGLSRSQLYKLSARGEIDILKIGKRAVVRRSDIERLLDKAPRLHPRTSEGAQARLKFVRPDESPATARGLRKSYTTAKPAPKGRRRTGAAA
jgi:hypothetical protein